MAISLPPKWRTKISSWHWRILVWTIDIGGMLLDVIDWVLGWINWGAYLGERAYNKAVAAWERAVEEAKELGKRIDREVDKLLRKLDTWWDKLDDWWDAKRQWVKDWVAARLQPLRDLITDTMRGLASLEAAWLSFRTTTLPHLVDKVTFWDNVRAETKPIKEDVARHESWLDLLKDLMADPEQWLLDRLLSMLARFI